MHRTDPATLKKKKKLRPHKEARRDGRKERDGVIERMMMWWWLHSFMQGQGVTFQSTHAYIHVYIDKMVEEGGGGEEAKIQGNTKKQLLNKSPISQSPKLACRDASEQHQQQKKDGGLLEGEEEGHASMHHLFTPPSPSLFLFGKGSSSSRAAQVSSLTSVTGKEGRCRFVWSLSWCLRAVFGLSSSSPYAVTHPTRWVWPAPSHPYNPPPF
jgi:hypothetical protein